MRSLLPALSLAVSSPALAGGVGLIGTGGFHTEHVYFYDDAHELDQYRQGQTVGTGGAGAEVLLGDRDDRIVGVMRLYWAVDGAQHDPAETTTSVEPDDVIAAWREDPRHIGFGSVGMSWGVIGNPDNFLLNAVGMLGSGFLTSDHEEFLFGELGAGASYRFTRQMQVHGNVAWHVRHRKGFQQGAAAYAGIRYYFD